MIPNNQITGTFSQRMTRVGHLSNDASAIRAAAGLDWNPLLVPLEMKGTREHRAYSTRGNSRFAIVNSRTGDVIDGGNPVADGFTLHKNGEILESVCDLATAAGLTIKSAGAIFGGEQVLVELPLGENLRLRSVLDDTREIGGYVERNEARQAAGVRVGDFLSGSLFLSISHVPGRTTRGTVRGERLACLNGAIVDGAENFLRLTHRERYTPEAVSAMISKFRESLMRYCGAYGRLVETPAPRALQALHIANVVEGPGFFDSVIEASVARGGDGAAAPLNPMRGFLDAILEKDEVEKLLFTKIREDGSRATKTILDVILDAQPGIEHVKGTLGQSYNAITNFYSHRYGRSEDGRAEANLRGPAADRQAAALGEGIRLAAVAAASGVN